MHTLKRLLLWLYSRFLVLYPAGFRDAFADELRIVFRLRIEDASHGGVLAVLWRGLCELRDLPTAAYHEHHREKVRRTMWARQNDRGFGSNKEKVNNMQPKAGFRLNIQTGSTLELLLALLPFLGTGLIVLLSALDPLLPIWVQAPLALLVLGTSVLLFLLGLASGFPRWSLPLAGAGISIAILPAAVLILQATGGSLNNILLGIGGLLILLLVFVFALRRLDFRRLLEDWTLVSFMGYGFTLTLLSFSFEGYRSEQIIQLVASLILALGAWVYLRAGSRSGRLAALVGGLVLAMLVVAAGQAWLINTGRVAEWQTDSWQVTVIQTIIFWSVAGLAAILGPALLSLLPIQRNAEPAG